MTPLHPPLDGPWQPDFDERDFPDWWWRAPDELGEDDRSDITVSPVDRLLEKVLPVDRSVLNAGEVAKLLGVSEFVVRRAIRNGDLPSLHFGVRYVVPIPALRRLLDASSPDVSIDTRTGSPTGALRLLHDPSRRKVSEP